MQGGYMVDGFYSSKHEYHVEYSDTYLSDDAILRPGQNDWYFAEGICKYVLLNDSCKHCIFMRFLLKFILFFRV